jgi:hypothetical protein
MNLNITYDQNTLNTAPSGFFSAVNYGVSHLAYLEEMTPSRLAMRNR